MTLAIGDYPDLDGTALAELVRTGQTTPAELLQCALDRARRINDRISAISLWFEDIAEREIDNLEVSAPFAGVPFLLKDLYTFMPGTPTTNGTRLAKPEISPLETTLVQRFRAAGLIPFGKTASPEFGMNVVTEPKNGPPCRNPWSLDRSPGGSSGGAAAAVAAGIVPVAHASDGGGSIRIPASSCGLFGMKPSRGLVPSGPFIGEGWSGLAVSNVVSRSVRDTARMLDAIAGAEPGSPYAAPKFDRRFADVLDKPCRSLRIALMEQPIVDVAVDDACLIAVRETASLLEDMGHNVETATPEIDGEAFADAFLTIVASNTANDLRAWQTRLQDSYDERNLENCTRLMAERGRSHSSVDLLGAIQTLHRGGRTMGRFLEQFDMVLSPTMAALPPKIGEIDQNQQDLDRFIAQNQPYTAFTALCNAVGCPAASLPLYWEAPLPVGVMLATSLGNDDLLIDIAADLEASRPWKHRKPPLN